MKRKKLPKIESNSKTVLLVVVSLGLIASLFFQLHLLREIDYLWTELDETYELLMDVLEHLQNARFMTQPYI